MIIKDTLIKNFKQSLLSAHIGLYSQTFSATHKTISVPPHSPPPKKKKKKAKTKRKKNKTKKEKIFGKKLKENIGQLT